MWFSSLPALSPASFPRMRLACKLASCIRRATRLSRNARVRASSRAANVAAVGARRALSNAAGERALALVFYGEHVLDDFEAHFHDFARLLERPSLPHKLKQSSCQKEQTAYMPWPWRSATVILRTVPPQNPTTSPPSRRTPSFEPEVALALGKVARSHREASGIPQDIFAYTAGIDRSYYGKIERGERQPSLGVLLRIARALGVSGAELLAAVEADLHANEPSRTY